jgi:hypothetical protein
MGNEIYFQNASHLLCLLRIDWEDNLPQYRRIFDIQWGYDHIGISINGSNQCKED